MKALVIFFTREVLVGSRGSNVSSNFLNPEVDFCSAWVRGLKSECSRKALGCAYMLLGCILLFLFGYVSVFFGYV